MQVKICGMREAANLAAIADLTPDYLGFIFYGKSARYMRDTLSPAQVSSLSAGSKRVGVFVDASLAEVQEAATTYGLDYVQLHGHETPDYCQQAHELGLRIIKAFAIDSAFDFSQLAAYAPACALFLFDTKGALPGGNGVAFDWQVLQQYHGPVGFLLSGGLGLANLPELLAFEHPYLRGYDFNSHLETAPGVKDADATRELLAQLRQQPTRY